MRMFLKNQRGASMMEILITVAILAIVVVPCLSAFVLAQKGNVRAKETQMQYTEASNLMEELKGIAEDAEGLGLVKVKERLNPSEKPEVDSEPLTYALYRVVPANANNTPEEVTGSYIVSQRKTYVEIWIYAGDALNEEIGQSMIPEDGYILHGVVVPNIKADNEAIGLVSELAELAKVKDKAWERVIARLAQPAVGAEDAEPSIYVLYQSGIKEVTDEHGEKNVVACIEVWMCEGTGVNEMIYELPTDINPILHGVILPNGAMRDEAEDMIAELTELAESDDWADKVLKRLSDAEDQEPLIYTRYRVVEPTEGYPAGYIEVWIYAGNENNGVVSSENELPTDIDPILHAVISSKNNTTEP